jgi:alpha-L-rhamnosidase
MDCASRERAGWLCDSFFTSRVEKELTGKSVVEKNFLENFIMPERFEHIEQGPFPMCYPADFLSGEFIPNWAMWYVLELEEYYSRTGDRELVELAKDKIFSLLKYFESFENESGLLENLRSWVFVEWSAANSFTNGVNYPSNMLYSRMLKSVGVLYDEKFLEKAKRIKDEINKQSYFDGFYHDHALRNSKNEVEVVKTDISETCQYYAFYMDCASPLTHPELLETLIKDFGADRAQSGKWKEVHPSNAFIGNYLRLDILCKEKLYDKVLEDIEGFFFHMVDKTGTLWEHQQPTGSCSHGFASHVIVWLHKIFR